jgi:hypothetical protein
MRKDDHLMFEALQKNVVVTITDYVDEEMMFSVNASLKQFDAAHVARAFVQRAYGKYDQDMVDEALQTVIDSMQVKASPLSDTIELTIPEFCGDGLDHFVTARRRISKELQ